MMHASLIISYTCVAKMYYTVKVSSVMYPIGNAVPETEEASEGRNRLTTRYSSHRVLIDTNIRDQCPHYGVWTRIILTTPHSPARLHCIDNCGH